MATTIQEIRGGVLAVDFTCECVNVDGSPVERNDYLVTGHGGTVSCCSYCDGCAEEAVADWNGETLACVPVQRAHILDACNTPRCPACAAESAAHDEATAERDADAREDEAHYNAQHKAGAL